MTRNSAALAASALMLAACGDTPEADIGASTEDLSGDTLAEIVSDDDSISVVSGLLESTGISGALEGEANYTLFAPTDTAMEPLGEAATKALGDESDGAIAAAILRNHMVPGALTPDAIRSAIDANDGSVTMATFGLSSLTFALDGETITVTNADGNSANLTGSSKIGKNGALLTIDAVLADSEALQP
ncbi:fasciclin domain-containing protein [Sphingomonadaceae bacterium]|nr:fasciclin domain-containing protein [Sphingomonadaceae bacterium]